MLQRALQEQSLQRQGNDPVRGISGHDPNSFAGLQGSQLGRCSRCKRRKRRISRVSTASD
jgi:hypothetical protein